MTQPLVSAEQLRGLLDSPTPPVVVDVRWSHDGTGHETYLRGHLPGAAWLDLETGLAAPHVPGVTGRHPMPALSVVEDALQRAGVSAGCPVVFYDQANSLAASRAWWLARHGGKQDVSVLDGGYDAWVAAGGAVDAGEVTPPRGDVTLTAGRGPASVPVTDIPAAVSQGRLIDGRPTRRFYGEGENMDPVAGHVPGARSVAALELLEPDGRFLPAERVRQRFADAGADPATAPVMMCGSGVQAAHLALAWEASGYSGVPADVWVGSWSEWITDPTRPVATTES